jgi:hypothetical protein
MLPSLSFPPPQLKIVPVVPTRKPEEPGKPELGKKYQNERK